jgi:hypothetical protein
MRLARRPPARIAVLALATFTIWGSVAPASVAARSRIAGRSEPEAAAGYTVAAAGDIVCQGPPSADPSRCQYDDTADLIVGQGFTRIVLLGDNQYDTGSLEAYRTWFDPTWGQPFRRLRPSPGNHEYAQDATARPRGYFRYFGKAVKGPDGLGYYSYDVVLARELAVLDAVLRPRRVWPGLRSREPRDGRADVRVAGG